MRPFILVEQGKDNTSIQKYRLHSQLALRLSCEELFRLMPELLPSPSRYFLFDPISETPEANMPMPIMRLAASPTCCCTSSRKPSRTAFEVLQPLRLMTSARACCASSSRRACTTVLMNGSVLQFSIL